MAFLDTNGLSTQIARIKAYVQNHMANYLPLMGGDITGTLTVNGANVLPPGAIWAYAGESMPSGGGWLLCDGSAVSRTTYENLFNVIGVIYGAGDGETTFNLPDLTNKFIEGSATVGIEKTAGLPNITGEAYLQPTAGSVDTVPSAIGAFTTTGEVIRSSNPGAGDSTFTVSSTSPYYTDNINLDASRSSSIYGNSTTVQPPALTLRYIIKY